MLEREADRMTHLVLTRENLDNEIKIVTEELRLATENDPFSRLFNQATKKLFGEHPYALWPTGTKEDIAAATVESCERFYEKYYGPNNAHLVVVGPVDAEETLAEVRRLFGAIEKRGATPPDVPSLYEWEFPDELSLREDLPPVEIALFGYPLPPPGSPDQWAIAAMSQMLWGGVVDPFREELVNDRGKAIEAGTQMLRLRRGGAVAFYSVSLPYRRKATAFKHMGRTIDKLERFEWATEERLAAAKRSQRRWELNQTYYAAGRAQAIGRDGWWLGDERQAFERVDHIDAVTLEQVKAAFTRYIAEPEPVRIYVKPERVPLLVRLFGWLYPLVAG